ncbi:UDP-N-acetyl-D-mannosamine dehydrogenase [Parasphingopyxis algicola]|uniref:UDP-N-acetyl-D-mannosamine dehydrogenase n=1 Tax=Parasphingopyxis algicola TaxID=2026624 RepID=UPI0015A4B29B|nr:UDP-N-acetyl-D-mannosamine dehydrogenase [Parasphingopyxis algicola]QLC26644.1 UDP-N-acetyl-D-mannosamine dehydrogenase [Parasphingopyxis algicola]
MPHEFKTVCVVGLGYIGLPTAATLASAGFAVKGADVDPDIVDELNEGRAHFPEPDLDMLVRGAVNSGRLEALSEPQPADAFVITVPTPIREDKSPDMSFVEAATRSVAPILEPGNLVILESTSPVGATDNMAAIIREVRPDLVEDDTLQVAVAYCPERILPGQMVRELVQNDRIVGGLTAADAERARDLYQSFVRGEIHLTDAKTAELVKLIENAYRDVNIAFANEVANIGEAHRLNPWEAIDLANRHPRVNILNPGPGVGGHCIAVDPWFLISADGELTGLMAEARRVNDGRPETVIAKIRSASAERGSRKVACLGLAFKPNVDDLRESPAVDIAIGLAAEGFEVCAVEPHVNALPEKLWRHDNIRLAGFDEAMAKSDIVVLLVGHKAFVKRKGDVGDKVVIDAVGLWREPSRAA